MIALDERRARGREPAPQRRIVAQREQRLRDGLAVLGFHHEPAARTPHHVGRVAAHGRHHGHAAGEVVEQLHGDRLAREHARARGGQAGVGAVQQPHQFGGRHARAELHGVQRALARGALEPFLRDAVAHQQQPHALPAQALGRVDQRLHAVHEAVRARVDRRERRARIAAVARRRPEQLGVRAVRQEHEPALLEPARRELALHARRHHQDARGAALEEPRDAVEHARHQARAHLAQRDRGVRPVVAAVVHERGAAQPRREPRRDAVKERRCGGQHHVGPRPRQRHRQQRERERQVVREARDRRLARRGVEPHPLHGDAVDRLGPAPRAAVLRPDLAGRVVRQPREHAHLVPGAHERPREVQRAGGRGARLGREVLRDEQDAHRGAQRALATTSWRRARSCPMRHWRWSGSRNAW